MIRDSVHSRLILTISYSTPLFTMLPPATLGQVTFQMKLTLNQFLTKTGRVGGSGEGGYEVCSAGDSWAR